MGNFKILYLFAEKCGKSGRRLITGLFVGLLWNYLQKFIELSRRICDRVLQRAKKIHEKTMKRYAKGFFKRIVDDFKYKQLLSLKMVFFVHASSKYKFFKIKKKKKNPNLKINLVNFLFKIKLNILEIPLSFFQIHPPFSRIFFGPLQPKKGTSSFDFFRI